MSQAAKSAKTAVASKVPTIPVYEILPPVTTVPEGIDPDTLPFSEWSDQEINAEKWDLTKAKPNPKEATASEGDGKFTDQHIVRMPKALIADTWKRPEEIYSQSNLVIYKESKNYPDLVSGSVHLLHSEFVRHFISSIGILQYLSDNRPSPIEFTTTTYVPTTEDMPWKPWHHIYSMCKGGKGQKHNPLVNQLGKYVVRLFWMGCWRKITIDDKFPIGHDFVLLPSLVDPLFTKKMVALSRSPSQNILPSHSTTDIELWPFLLSKALLKLSNLTQTRSKELLDFDIIQCLTGWFSYKIEVLGINDVDVWEMCSGYSDHYTWPDPLNKSSVSGSKSSKTTTVPNFLDDDNLNVTPFHLIGVCSDMKLVKEHVVPDVSPCWSHSFLIDQTRNIPLIKPEPLPELAPWKQFRWLDWAIQKGIWKKPDPETFSCIKMVSDFKKRSEHVKFETPSQESIIIQNNVTMIEKLALQLSGKEDSRKEQTNADRSIWVDFNKIVPYLSHLCLYFKLSRFKNVTRITNILQKDDGKGVANKAKGGKGPVSAATKLLMWNNELLCSRNEPIYIFCDSLDYKLMVINLAQEGNVDAIKNLNSTAELNAVPFSYALLEDYDWRFSKIGDTVISLSTYGNKTLLMEIKPGRFVFRMWLKSEKSFFIHVMSDSEIEIGSLEYVLEYMKRESERLMKYCDDISSSYGQLVQKFGTHSYKDALKLFYKSYLPENTLTKNQLLTVHDNFMKEFIKIVENNSSKEEMNDRLYALKVLFLNPNINYTNPHSLRCNEFLSLKDTSSTDTIEVLKMKQRATVILQAAFRKMFVINLYRAQNQQHQKHLKIFENLKSIYNDVFSIFNRMDVCGDLLRNFLLNNSAMSVVSEEYSILKDLKSTIHLKHFLGSMHLLPNYWVPINRYIFYCNSAHLTTVKICLFCNLTKFVVRVFNNDTREEVTRFANNAVVTEYKSNMNGYTVFCYGWSEFEEECKWKLNLITVKTKSVSTIIIPEVQIINNVIRKIYRPNVYNYICRCLIKIEHDVILSFRLSTTFKEVELRLRCLNELGEVFAEISGKTSVILPAILLRHLSTNLNRQSTFNSTTSVSSKEIKSKTRMNSMKPKKRLRSFDRLSLERRASKQSLIMDTLSTDDNKVKETTYLIESFVLNDSWPLTKTEWLVVEEFKNRSLLGQSSNESLISSFSNSKKLGGSFSGRRTSDRKTNLDFNQLSPQWILEVVSNEDDHILTLIDHKRQDEINDIKRKWYENSSDRYAKSKKIRKQFLEMHYIKTAPDLSLELGKINKNSTTLIKQATSDTIFEDHTRSLIKPDIPFKTLPPFNLTEYVREDLKDSNQLEKCVLTPNVEEMLLNKQDERIKEFEKYHERYKEDMCKFLNEQTGKYKLLNDFFQNCVNESKDLMTYAYSVRTQVINKIIDDSLEVATDDFF